jgi:hypothetical protein
MLLQIDDTQTVGQLQDAFSGTFPQLRIAFCRTAHQWEELTDDSQFIPATNRIGTIRKSHQAGSIEIKSSHKIGEVEERFQGRFGLNVQILFRGRRRWIQTGKSDNLTIEDLLRHVSLSSRPIL